MVRFGPIVGAFLPGDYPEWFRWAFIVVTVLLSTILSLMVFEVFMAFATTW